jgi:hypothetical protein
MKKVEGILMFLVGTLFVYSLIFWTAFFMYNMSQSPIQIQAITDVIQKDVQIAYETMSKEVADIFAAVDSFQQYNPNQPQFLPSRMMRSPLQASSSIEQQLLAQQLQSYRL